MNKTIKQFLGNEVVKVPLALLKHSSLAESDRDFLASVGLPTRDGLLFPFFKRADEFTVWNYEGHSYLVLAEERGQKLCLNLDTGNIFIIDARNELPTRFVNSNIESLVEFIKDYTQAKDAFLQAPEASITNSLSELHMRFSNKDPQALEDEESWWPVVLEQTEQGLM
jgi:hypothetical protein